MTSEFDVEHERLPHRRRSRWKKKILVLILVIDSLSFGFSFLFFSFLFLPSYFSPFFSFSEYFFFFILYVTLSLGLFSLAGRPRAQARNFIYIPTGFSWSIRFKPNGSFLMSCLNYNFPSSPHRQHTRFLLWFYFSLSAPFISVLRSSLFLVSHLSFFSLSPMILSSGVLKALQPLGHCLVSGNSLGWLRLGFASELLFPKATILLDRCATLCLSARIMLRPFSDLTDHYFSYTRPVFY